MPSLHATDAGLYIFNTYAKNELKDILNVFLIWKNTHYHMKRIGVKKFCMWKRQWTYIVWRASLMVSKQLMQEKHMENVTKKIKKPLLKQNANGEYIVKRMQFLLCNQSGHIWFIKRESHCLMICQVLKRCVLLACSNT